MAFILKRAAGVNATDVINSYKVFLGRAPESENIIAHLTGASFEKLFLHLLRSEEFGNYVYKAILVGEIARVPRFSDKVTSDINVWAADVFKLAPTAKELDGNRRWSDLLRVGLSAIRLEPWSKTLDPHMFSEELQQALTGWSESEKTSSIIGGIDLSDARRVIGWVMNRDDQDSALVVELFANGRFVAAAKTEIFRRDLQATYGGRGLYGFSLSINNAVNVLDQRQIKLEVIESATRKMFASATVESQSQRSLDQLGSIARTLNELKDSILKIESQIPALRHITSFSVESYDAYVEAYRSARFERTNFQSHHTMSSTPIISVIIIVSDRNIADLEQTLECINKQPYQNIEIILASTEPRSSTRAMPRMDAIIAGVVAPICQLWPDNHREVGQAVAAAIETSRGALVCTLESGDLLAPSALDSVARVLEDQPDTVVIYSDQDSFHTLSHGKLFYHDPIFNAQYDPLILLQTEFIGGLIALRGDVLRDLEGSESLERNDPTVRLLQICDYAGTHRISHIPKVLLHKARRRLAANAREIERRMIHIQARQDALGEGGRVEIANDPLGAMVQGALRLGPTGLQGVTATVIIPTRDNAGLLRSCVEGILGAVATNTVSMDILIVDNGGVDADALAYLADLKSQDRVRVVRDDRPFNWSALNNAAAQSCRSDVLIFLNDDMRPITPDWCDELCFWALRPDTGPVGARLVYEDGSIQHAGVVGGVFGLAAHEGVGAPGNDAGYLGRHAIVRKAFAVTGACLAVRRSVFEHLGGFDADTFAVTYNDVDFCLRARDAGFQTVYTPYATLYHFESKTRGFDFLAPALDRAERSKEADAIISRWGERLLHDPTYNPHFDRWSRPFTRLTAIDAE